MIWTLGRYTFFNKKKLISFTVVHFIRIMLSTKLGVMNYWYTNMHAKQRFILSNKLGRVARYATLVDFKRVLGKHYTFNNV